MNIPYTSNPARNTMYFYPPSTIQKMHEGQPSNPSSHAENVACVILMVAVVIVAMLIIRLGLKTR